MEKIYKNTFLMSLLLGFLAGFLATLLGGEYYFNKWYLERVASEGDEGSSSIIIQSPEKVEVTQDLRIKEVVEQVDPSMVIIYRKKRIGRDTISQIYQKKDLVGYGLILTSDGWLISAGESLDGVDARQLVVIYNQRIKEIVKKIIDPTTNTVLFKIDAVDLPVVKFGSMDDLLIGGQLIVINREGVRLTNLINISYINGADLLYSSEKYYKYLLLTNREAASGAAVINFGGDLVGLVSGGAEQGFSKAVPIDFLQRSIKSVLRGEEIDYPYLGVHFLDISSGVGLNEQVAKGLSAGALLYGRGAKRAINGDSPLTGLLEEGDVITKVNNQEISSKKSLSELILNKRKGETVELEYVSEKGKQEVVEVELK